MHPQVLSFPLSLHSLISWIVLLLSQVSIFSLKQCSCTLQTTLACSYLGEISVQVYYYGEHESCEYELACLCCTDAFITDWFWPQCGQEQSSDVENNCWNLTDTIESRFIPDSLSKKAIQKWSTTTVVCFRRSENMK